MKITRRNLLLLAVVLVLVGADLALRPAERPGAPAGRLLPGLDVARVARVSLRGAEGEVDLERDEDGWVVVQRQRFSAHALVVDELERRLAGLSRTDRVSNETGSQDAYGLGDGAIRLELDDDGGEPLAVVWIGKPAGLAQGAYVRIDDEEEVYRAPTLPVVETDPAFWIDKRLVDLDSSAVRSLRIEEPARGIDLRLTRLEDGRWRAGGRSTLLTAAEVDPLLLVASNLYFEDLSDAIAGAPALDPGAPAIRLQFDLDGGEARGIALGEPGAKGEVAATNVFWRTPWSVVLPSRTASRLEAAIQRIAASN